MGRARGQGPEPPRLAAERFMAPSSVRIYHQMIGDAVAPHWHEFYEMHLIVAGRAMHAINGIARPVARGSLALLTPSDVHALDPEPDAPVELYNVVFADEMIPADVRPLLFEGGAPDPDAAVRFDAPGSGGVLDPLEAEFIRLWAEMSTRRTGYERAVQATLERVLIDVARLHTARGHAGVPGGGCVDRPRRDVRVAIIYMHHHFREPLTLERVAAQAHLSPHYFSTAFHRATGSSFQTYLGDLRLRFARTLLRVSDLSVTEVCHAAGFGTLSHFERAFRCRFGATPSGYRDGQGGTTP